MEPMIEDGLNAMKCKDSFQKIYGRIRTYRDNFKSFNYVNNDILYNHNLSDKEFFDDLKI